MYRVHLSTGTAGGRIGQPSVWIDCDLHEPSCEWLNQEICDRSSRPNTWAQAARSVVSWLDFLEAYAIDWRHASRDDVVRYRDDYLAAISPLTKQSYSAQTVLTRMTYIIDFLKYSVSRGWLDSDLAGDPSVMVRDVTPRIRQIDQDSLAHTRKGSVQSGADRLKKLLPKSSHDETVRVLRKEELAALLRWAGPRAGQRKENDGGCDRDRVVFDLAWAVGLRVDEIMLLKTYPFEVIVPDPQYASEMFQLSVTGKGNKLRIVDVPAWLVIDIQAYIGGERRRCLKRRGPTARESQLILNGESSRNRFGRPMTSGGMQALMRRACKGAGLMKPIERKDPETEKVVIKKVAKFSLHCLRHTYAVMTYHNHIASKLSGVEAWKYIQMQLGHASPQTTMDVYLRHVTAWSDMRNSRTLLDMVGA